jgi:aerobic carbon-monoxide dehydrogenase medium subunit
LADVKPAPFDYSAPRTLDDAVQMLKAGGPTAKVLAGGQSLVPLLNFRLAVPTLLVDLNRIDELAYVTQRDRGVAIGAMTRQVSVERDAYLARVQPLLHEAIGWIGHPAIRSRGTIGGSLAHADPAAELPAVAVCLGAKLGVIGPNGRRSISAEDFFQGYLSTALEADEILTEVWLPSLRPGTGQVWLESARRHGDFALVGVAVSISLDHKCVGEVRIVLTGVGGKPVRVREAETLLIGSSVEERAGAAADLVRSVIEPDTDLHASREYRAHLAAVLTERAIRLAHERALQSVPSAQDVRRVLEGMNRLA